MSLLVNDAIDSGIVFHSFIKICDTFFIQLLGDFLSVQTFHNVVPTILVVVENGVPIHFFGEIKIESFHDGSFIVIIVPMAKQKLPIR